MRRRVFLAGGAGAVAAVSAQSVVGCSSRADDTGEGGNPSDEVARLRAQYPDFDADYVDNAIPPVS